MLIKVLDLQREPLDFSQVVPEGVIDYGSACRQMGGMTVEGRAELILEHRGAKEIVEDIRLRADFQGRFEVPCARCLEPVEHAISDNLDLLFRPLGADTGSSEHSISTSDTEIGYYQDDGLVLEDVLREQVLLSLPAKTLCRQDCKGLCPRCGQNLNQETCACEAGPSDPRWNALANIRSRMKK